ncbi:methyltransferase domain-containing protein [Hirsutella rhossiliensis]|uniref:Methyltransferase domain-containing protein n=1 Tax=Hirsutella rhossiliensis TaxID=111463 RepID=A0A9P8SNP0_9HYPO|nr:methyltransferase domain-containing protein [Hirsutella rhossiliensis]KAH0967356.1 methyltransferase domain-containing protein [Hirsutella rhossiliensis]
MAEALRLPNDRYMSRDSSLAPRQKRLLNPIIEEDSDDGQVPQAATGRRTRRGDSSHLKIEAWLSPVSDHFPTPRGMHYLAAPILPSSPSTVSGADSSPTNSSNPWNRASLATENTEFEDLYDVSEEDDGPPGAVEAWSAVDKLKKTASPVPPTPSVKLHMSPAQVEFMGKQQALEVPTISAPPSLDGSFSSEQLAAMSAPVTPVIGNDEATTDEAWAGVHLQPGALATLQALSCGEDEVHEQPSQLLEIPQAPSYQAPEMRQQPLRLVTSFSSQLAQERLVSPNRHSLAELTRLEIPSPGGFFSGLSPRTRSTWHMLANSPEGLHPPTSTTAEQFYRCPWNSEVPGQPASQRPDPAEDFYRSFDLSSAPVERVVEHKDSDSSEETIKSPSSPRVQDAPTEIVIDYDPDYARKQQKVALSNLDRTELWLLAQRAYLTGISNVVEDDVAPKAVDEVSEAEEAEAGGLQPERDPERDPASQKKVVRFSVISSPAAQPKNLPHKLLQRESAYYRAFQDYIVRTQRHDVFIHQLARFEALQAQRVALRKMHRNQLLGKYQLSVVPQSAKKRLSANVARGDLVLTDDPERLRREKEFEAANQMAMPTWHVAAIKFLNGGRLITAPVTKQLAQPSCAAPELDGSYPNAKVYTVTTKAIRQLSNSNIRGPPNHRQVAVERLTQLPFADDQFDLISARELHSILKFFGENGEDEWEGCLRECMRVLRPGGYLEFSILDSDIINAGPLGLAKSVEFGFSLKTLGYDPSPSRMWLGRLARAGFEDVRRVWMCLPLRAKRKVHTPPMPPSSSGAEGDGEPTVRQMDAMVMGSSDDIASMCSVVGGWSWERWLLRCEMEKVAGELRLADTVTTGTAVREADKCLEGVHAVMEEGSGCKAGFRMLNGYARKSRAGNDEVIRVALAD